MGTEEERILLRSLTFWILDFANVFSKFFVPLRYVIPLHFIQRCANEGTGRVKHPHALGAAVAVELLALGPY
jgi:hypothetical protein